MSIPRSFLGALVAGRRHGLCKIQSGSMLHRYTLISRRRCGHECVPKQHCRCLVASARSQLSLGSYLAELGAGSLGRFVRQWWRAQHVSMRNATEASRTSPKSLYDAVRWSDVGGMRRHEPSRSTLHIDGGSHYGAPTGRLHAGIIRPTPLAARLRVCAVAVARVFGGGGQPSVAAI